MCGCIHEASINQFSSYFLYFKAGVCDILGCVTYWAYLFYRLYKAESNTHWKHALFAFTLNAH